MSTYPGNASLSSAVKDRVLSTFQQALALHKQGRAAEVVEGCTLILRMDPTFDPARKLLEKTRNPNSPIDVDSLMPAAPGAEALMEARAALKARDFQRAAELTSELLRNDFTNEEARIVNDAAREKTEAAPFVEQFIRKAEMFAKQGNSAAARTELEKARALDGDHPGIRRITDSITTSEPAPSSFSSGGSPSFVVEAPQPAPAARGAAQATDFGFTFEEEKPAESSFGSFSFDATPASPARGEFDFSAASSAPSGDDHRKIQQYLADGDRAAKAGDYQQAIDLWSRIFLFDVTNDEASLRIEAQRFIELLTGRFLVAGVERLLAGGDDRVDLILNLAALRFRGLDPK